MLWTLDCSAKAMARRPDSELIAEGRKGNTQALSELFERHYSTSIRVARRILRSDEEAFDVVQSAYLAAFEHLRSFRGDAQFKTWITRIVKNQCFMYLRRPERRYVRTDLDEIETRAAEAALAHPTPTPEDLAWRREIDSALSDAAGRLPKRLHDVYILCCNAGLPIREAAAMLGLTMPATKTRLFRAQHRMRSALRARLVLGVPTKIITRGRPRHSAANPGAQVAA
jgi:RNA polymerase sigma-70 factor, ECF subfamily